jgi:hypothetical protein
MAISRVAQYTGDDYAASVTVTISATPTAGDILIGAVCCSVNAVSTPAGWTLLASQVQSTHQLAAYYKISAGNETSVVFDDGTTGTKAAGVVVYRGSNVAPVGYADTGTDTNSDNIAAPTQSSVPSRSVIVAIGACFKSASGAITTTTSGSGWAEVTDANNSHSLPNSSRTLSFAENTTGTGSVTGATFTFSTTATELTAASCYLRAPNMDSLLMGSV